MVDPSAVLTVDCSVGYSAGCLDEQSVDLKVVQRVDYSACLRAA